MILLDDLPHAANPAKLSGGGDVLRRRGVQVAGRILDLSLGIRSNMLSQQLKGNSAWHLLGVLLRLHGDLPPRYFRSDDLRLLLGCGLEQLHMSHHALPEPADGLPLVLVAACDRAL